MYSLSEDFRQLPWYTYARSTRKQGWTPIFASGITPSLLMRAFAPVYDSAGQFQGVFTSDVGLPDVSTFLSTFHLAGAGEVFILEHSGDLVATSTPEKLYLQQGTASFRRVSALQSANARTRDIAKQLVHKLGDFSTLQTTQQLSLVHNQQRQFVQVTPYQDAYGLDWLIVIVVPESDFMAKIHANARNTAMLCVGALVLAIALGLLSTNKISQRIEQINRASQKLAEGNLEQQIVADSSIAELHRLAQSFNQMARQLKDSFQHVQQALQESEQKFTKIFRNSPDPIALATLSDGCCVEANDSFLTLLEYSREQVIGQRLLDLGVWGDLDDRARVRQALQQHGYVRNLEVRSRTRTGKIKTVLISSEVIEIQGTVYSLGIGRDITDRKQLEAEREAVATALHQSRERYRAIVEDQTELICRFLPDGTLTFVNASYCRYFASSETALLGTNFLDLVPDSEREAVIQLLQQLNTLTPDNPSLDQEHLALKPDGQIGWQRWTNRALFTPMGELVEFQSVGWDITDRKTAELENLQLRQRLEFLLARTPATIYTCKIDGDYGATFISENVRLLLGYAPEEFTQNSGSWASHIHPDDVATVLAGLRVLFENGYHTHEYRFLHQDGTYSWVRNGLNLIRDAEGNPVEIVGYLIDITDRKIAEIALQQSETRFLEISHSSPANIYIFVRRVDGSFYFEHMSRAIEAIHEIPVKQILENSQVLLTCIHPEDQADYYAAVNHSLETLQPFQHEWRVLTPSGKTKWVQGNSRPQQRDNGEVAWYGIVLDITDRKQAEQALRHNEEQLRLLTDALPVFISYTDTEQRYVFVNKAYETHFGLSRDQIYGRYTRDIIGETNYNLVHPQIEQALAGESVRYEITVPNSQEGDRHLSVMLIPDRDSQSQVRGYYTLILDISDRKRMEQQLRRSEERYRRLTEISPVGVFRDDANGYCTYVNEKALQLAGLSLEEYLQLNWLNSIHPDDRLLVYQAWQEFVARSIVDETATYRLECRHLHLDGSIVWVLVQAVPERNASGEITGYIGTVTDISDRKQAEELVRQSEARYLSILDQQTELISRCTPDGTLIFVNDAFCRYHGVAREVLIGQSYKPRIYLPDQHL
jgi:PAS domain S-box-containing protein